jgi:hypothetical protein
MFIQDIVDVSGNEQWAVNLANIIADGDFLSRYIKVIHTLKYNHNSYT